MELGWLLIYIYHTVINLAGAVGGAWAGFHTGTLGLELHIGTCYGGWGERLVLTPNDLGSPYVFLADTLGGGSLQQEGVDGALSAPSNITVGAIVYLRHQSPEV